MLCVSTVSVGTFTIWLKEQFYMHLQSPGACEGWAG